VVSGDVRCTGDHHLDAGFTLANGFGSLDERPQETLHLLRSGTRKKPEDGSL
jgi:hypothetical protein